MGVFKSVIRRDCLCYLIADCGDVRCQGSRSLNMTQIKLKIPRLNMGRITNKENMKCPEHIYDKPVDSLLTFFLHQWEKAVGPSVSSTLYCFLCNLMKICCLFKGDETLLIVLGEEITY